MKGPVRKEAPLFPGYKVPKSLLKKPLTAEQTFALMKRRELAAYNRGLMTPVPPVAPKMKKVVTGNDTALGLVRQKKYEKTVQDLTDSM
jgi:hypothetical protein